MDVKGAGEPGFAFVTQEGAQRGTGGRGPHGSVGGDAGAGHPRLPSFGARSDGAGRDR